MVHDDARIFKVLGLYRVIFGFSSNGFGKKLDSILFTLFIEIFSEMLDSFLATSNVQNGDHVLNDKTEQFRITMSPFKWQRVDLNWEQ